MVSGNSAPTSVVATSYLVGAGEVFDKLARNGPVLAVVVVDQPASVGARPAAVARDPRAADPDPPAPVEQIFTALEGGNKQLKRAFFVAAFASLSHPQAMPGASGGGMASRAGRGGKTARPRVPGPRDGRRANEA